LYDLSLNPKKNKSIDNSKFCTGTAPNYENLHQSCTKTTQNTDNLHQICTEIKNSCTETTQNADNLHQNCTEIKISCTGTTQNEDNLHQSCTGINQFCTDFAPTSDDQCKNDENKIFCNDCKKEFTRISSLRRHTSLNRCSKNNKSINTVNNVFNNTINNTLNFNFGINNEKIKTVQFDSDWDLSSFDLDLKKSLLLSTIKYTQTMDEIFKNDCNLNVFIKDEKDTGIVYKNETEKLKEMSVNEIVNTSMKKLHKYLKQFYEDIKNDNKYNICIEYLDDQLKNVETKYENFNDNVKTQKTVKDLMLSIYDKNKDKTVEIYKDIIKNDNMIENINGY